MSTLASQYGVVRSVTRYTLGVLHRFAHMNMATYSQKFEPERLVVQHGHNVLVYILKGDVVIRAAEREQKVSAEHAVALHSR